MMSLLTFKCAVPNDTLAIGQVDNGESAQYLSAMI